MSFNGLIVELLHAHLGFIDSTDIANLCLVSKTLCSACDHIYRHYFESKNNVEVAQEFVAWMKMNAAQPCDWKRAYVIFHAMRIWPGLWIFGNQEEGETWNTRHNDRVKHAEKITFSWNQYAGKKFTAGGFVNSLHTDNYGAWFPSYGARSGTWRCDGTICFRDTMVSHETECTTAIHAEFDNGSISATGDLNYTVSKYSARRRCRTPNLGESIAFRSTCNMTPSHEAGKYDFLKKLLDLKPLAIGGHASLDSENVF